MCYCVIVYAIVYIFLKLKKNLNVEKTPQNRHLQFGQIIIFFNIWPNLLFDNIKYAIPLLTLGMHFYV